MIVKYARTSPLARGHGKEDAIMGFKFRDSAQAYANALLKEVREKGGGTLHCQYVLNDWIAQARKANVSLETRKAVTALVRAANI